MVTITLPDGSKRNFDAPVTVLQVAESIGPGLAKAALAGKVDGLTVDTSHLLVESFHPVTHLKIYKHLFYFS